MDNTANEQTETLPRYDASERSCLKCGNSFFSEWTGERVCKRCKQSSEWKNSDPFSLHA